ncbi:MAG: type II toxin-antitoxin system RelE/ParE family toxin [Acidobacteria bacterium]|nr:type II toxin-antitoxin system RelE/ParE family toxin [Acidobacteriota bacterium]
MSYRVEITEKAERAVRDIVRWIAETSPEKAMDWHADFLDAVESLETFPARCAIIPETEGQPIFRHRIFGKYRIIFRIEDETVYVVHVRHQKQRPLNPRDI